MKTVNYLTFMKHAKKVAKKASKFRTALQHISHEEDGSVVVTDSHRLYRINNGHNEEKSFVTTADGIRVSNPDFDYPQTDRLIQRFEDASHVFTVSTKEFFNTVKAIELANKVSEKTRNNELKMTVYKQGISLETDNKNFCVRYENGSTHEGDKEFDMYLSTQYMKEALHVIDDSKVDTLQVAIYNSHMRPIQLFTENFTAIILPIKKY